MEAALKYGYRAANFVVEPGGLDVCRFCLAFSKEESEKKWIEMSETEAEIDMCILPINNQCDCLMPAECAVCNDAGECFRVQQLFMIFELGASWDNFSHLCCSKRIGVVDLNTMNPRWDTSKKSISNFLSSLFLLHCSHNTGVD